MLGQTEEGDEYFRRSELVAAGPVVYSPALAPASDGNYGSNVVIYSEWSNCEELFLTYTIRHGSVRYSY